MKAALLVALLVLTSPASFAKDSPFGAEAAIDDATLDGIRGGFVTPAGLQISFGIERAVYLNGNLVTTTSLNGADGIAPSQAARALALIQSGTNNSYGAAVGSTAAATVIQNSLDNQKIQGITTINATVNSLDLLKRTSLTSSIQGALAGSLRR